jgi:hypothetical protein
MRDLTVLFVHGTGVRLPDFQSTLEKIEAGLRTPEWHNLRIEGCNWGDLLGSRPAVNSVPDFLETGGNQITDEEAKLQTWRLLDADPLCELRLLVLNKPDYQLRAPREARPESLIESGLKNVEIQALNKLQPILARAEVAAEFLKNACAVVKKDAAYVRFLRVAENPVGRYLDALANALVAQAILLAEEAILLAAKEGGKRGKQPRIVNDGALRDELTAEVRECLGPREAAPWDPIVKKLGGFGSAALGVAAYAGSLAFTPYVNLRRGRFSQTATPIAGDILHYQCRGKEIRKLIRNRLIDLPSPVVVLAHSLGGVACVDLLIKRDLRDRIPLLITVGSQAPYFYEINALHSLKYKETARLPDHFPQWVNLYNRRDFLSYTGAKVFPGKVEDCPVEPLHPFPQSHSAYWTTRATYDCIRKAIRDYVR